MFTYSFLLLASLLILNRENIMPILNLKHYKKHKKPFVAKIVSTANGGTEPKWLKKTPLKISSDGSYGDYAATVDEEGLYHIGHTKTDDCGYRIFYSTSSGNRFPFIRCSDAIRKAKERIAEGEDIKTIVDSLIEDGLIRA